MLYTCSLHTQADKEEEVRRAAAVRRRRARLSTGEEDGRTEGGGGGESPERGNKRFGRAARVSYAMCALSLDSGRPLSLAPPIIIAQPDCPSILSRRHSSKSFQPLPGTSQHRKSAALVTTSASWTGRAGTHVTIVDNPGKGGSGGVGGDGRKGSGGRGSIGSGDRGEDSGGEGATSKLSAADQSIKLSLASNPSAHWRKTNAEHNPLWRDECDSAVPTPVAGIGRRMRRDSERAFDNDAARRGDGGACDGVESPHHLPSLVSNDRRGVTGTSQRSIADREGGGFSGLGKGGDRGSHRGQSVKGEPRGVHAGVHTSHRQTGSGGVLPDIFAQTRLGSRGALATPLHVLPNISSRRPPIHSRRPPIDYQEAGAELLKSMKSSPDSRTSRLLHITYEEIRKDRYYLFNIKLHQFTIPTL